MCRSAVPLHWIGSVMLCATVSAVPLHWIGSVMLCTRSTIGVFAGFWGFFFILLGYGGFCFAFSMYLFIGIWGFNRFFCFPFLMLTILIFTGLFTPTGTKLLPSAITHTFLLFFISDAYNSYIYRSLYAHWDEASPECHNAYIYFYFYF